MSGVSAAFGTVATGLVLWIAGLHVFDAVHVLLHRMMRARRRWLRALAAPHRMHHAWLDQRLRTRHEYRGRNVWGHLVLEFGTQLAFSGLLLVVVPPSAVAVCVAVQTMAFAYVLSQGGLDPNHRPIAMLDAYRPSLIAWPAYHALHHVYPDAYFSAYSKLVDYAIASGAHLRGKRIVVVGGETPFGRALVAGLGRAGAGTIVASSEVDADALATADVLAICDPAAGRLAWVEAFIRATRARQLPPEVWAVQTAIADRLARHYYRDVRVTYRALAVAAPRLRDAPSAARAARQALTGIRRGFNFVPTSRGTRALRDFLRFRLTAPHHPAHTGCIPRRAALADPAA